jgi:hypothetical protein
MSIARIRFDASFELPTERRGWPLPALGGVAAAALMAMTSLAGILVPSLYAKESVNWAAQAVGQDWVDLLVAVPWLAITTVLSARGSLRAAFLLAGGLAYTLYEFVIYGFSLHFNALFLVYCAELGVSFFALVGLAHRFARDDASRWFSEPVPARGVGVFLIAIGACFAMAWLGDIVPAVISGTVPQTIAEAGTTTNPVYVLDLAVVLPLHVVAGVALLRRRPVGKVLAPVILSFGVLMALSIAGMMFVMRLRGVEASIAVAIAMMIVSTASAVFLGMLLAKVRKTE